MKYLFSLLIFFAVTNLSSQEANKVEYLYKIIKFEQLNNNKDHIDLGDNDTDYVHFSKEDQWQKIAKKNFSKQQGYYLLKFNKKDLESLGNLVFEFNTSKTEKYYHLKPKDNKLIILYKKLILEQQTFYNQL